MANRYESMFASLDAKNQGAFVPFVMLGDPDVQTSLAICQTLIDNGADALELGIPYSDPIADGPTIQAASIRALAHKVTTADCLGIIAKLRETNPDTPIGLLLYSNLVLAKGIDDFYGDCAEAGVDSILIADVPVRESELFIAAAKRNGIQQILISPPNATDETMAKIGEFSEGYTYLLGRAGVTGAETAAQMPAKQLIDRLKGVDAAPPLLGFGISKPEQVNDAIVSGAAGAISGSATVKIIEQHLNDLAKLHQELGAFVGAMKAATQKD